MTYFRWLAEPSPRRIPAIYGHGWQADFGGSLVTWELPLLNWRWHTSKPRAAGPGWIGCEEPPWLVNEISWMVAVALRNRGITKRSLSTNPWATNSPDCAQNGKDRFGQSGVLWRRIFSVLIPWCDSFQCFWSHSTGQGTINFWDLCAACSDVISRVTFNAG